jgi:hypothetical protein
VSWHSLRPANIRKWLLSLPANLKFSGERLQVAQLGSVSSSRSVPLGSWWKVTKYKPGFQSHHWN